ncbi:uncharacterized protein LOC116351655 [Contarinia nasturtii]|uniref:uncharacterized protein LOC116351655 n=1 Tax=Contarinia nasturtii TaxID=265458 RepID=UPI0012D411A6|nr:uncharacterized protein LOC116351655 [Contarinia nasturtii]
MANRQYRSKSFDGVYEADGNNSSVPWLPRKITFKGIDPVKAVQKQLPKLLPINMPVASTSQNVPQQSGNNDGSSEAEMLQTQIKLSTKAMETVENLQKKMDQMMKEKEYYKSKLAEANSMLQKFKPNGKKESDGKKQVDGEKEADEKNDTDGQKENVEPNKQ